MSTNIAFHDRIIPEVSIGRSENIRWLELGIDNCYVTFYFDNPDELEQFRDNLLEAFAKEGI